MLRRRKGQVEVHAPRFWFHLVRVVGLRQYHSPSCRRALRFASCHCRITTQKSFEEPSIALRGRPFATWGRGRLRRGPDR